MFGKNEYVFKIVFLAIASRQSLVAMGLNLFKRGPPQILLQKKIVKKCITFLLVALRHSTESKNIIGRKRLHVPKIVADILHRNAL